jgi:rod shape-determining protein MreC
MFIDHRANQVQRLRGALMYALIPIQYTASFPIHAVDVITTNIRTNRQLLRDNKDFRAENLLLHAQVQRLASLESENIRLKTLLKASARAGDKVLVASLIKVDTDPFSQKVVLNKGLQQHVYIGQPVIDAHGIMGQIIDVSDRTSVALLLTDQNHALPVRNNRSGERGIAVGSGPSGNLELSHVTTTADVKVGDLLISSGLGQRFPAGYPVGVISSIKNDPGEAFATIVVKPAADISKSSEVLLVWPEETGNFALKNLLEPAPKQTR